MPRRMPSFWFIELIENNLYNDIKDVWESVEWVLERMNHTIRRAYELGEPLVAVIFIDMRSSIYECRAWIFPDEDKAFCTCNIDEYFNPSEITSLMFQLFRTRTAASRLDIETHVREGLPHSWIRTDTENLKRQIEERLRVRLKDSSKNSRPRTGLDKVSQDGGNGNTFTLCLMRLLLEVYPESQLSGAGLKEALKKNGYAIISSDNVRVCVTTKHNSSCRYFILAIGDKQKDMVCAETWDEVERYLKKITTISHAAPVSST